jgi:hypothetical protein
MAFQRSKQYLKDPEGSDTLTYVNEEYSQDPSGQYYQDPYEGQYNLPEGQTYIAPSLAPTGGMKSDPGARPQDVSPVDWKMGNTLDPERTQRNIIRQYLAQKYSKAADSSGVDAARQAANRQNTIGNVGEALSTAFTAHSVAHKGPGANSGYWQNFRQQGQQGLQNAEAERKAKIEDYLTQKKLGQEGVAELSQMREMDKKAAMDNPQSEVSQRYQTWFAQRYPEYAEQVQGVPASEIDAFAKYLQDAEKVKAEKEYRDDTLDLRRDELDFQREKLGADQDYRSDVLAAKQQGSGTIERIENPDGSITERVIPKSKAVDALDRDYVKEYNDWTSNDKSEYLKNRKILENAVSRLKKAKDQGVADDISGRGVYFKGKIGEGALRSEDSLKIEQDVQQAALGGLKATFGGNPTEGERKAILEKAYDPKLSVDSNIEKILRTIDDLDAKAASKDEKSKYFEQSQTLGGFKSSGQKPMRVIEPDDYKVPDQPMVLKSTQNKEAMVKIQAPDGSMRFVPKSSVDKYVKKGGKVVQ